MFFRINPHLLVMNYRFQNIASPTKKQFVCKYKIILNLIFLILITRISFAYNTFPYHDVQRIVNIKNYYSQDSIKSIKIHLSGWELSDPIVELNTTESVTLRFDDLSDMGNSFSYTIVHCTKDWEPSNLTFYDYLDGFEFNPVKSSQNSMGTIVPYTHYQVQIPNEDVKLKLSGNYLIRVVDTYDYSRTFFEVRFRVIEPIIAINTSIIQPLNADKRMTSQQLNLTFSTNTLMISNPLAEIYTNIYQNGQVDELFLNLKPYYVNGKELQYTSPDGLIFNGVNEFRSFDIKSIRYTSPRIANILQVNGETGIMLKPDENRSKQKYSSDQDINGRYLIKLENSEQSELEADYLWVYFSLPSEELMNREVYIYGDLSGWECKSSYKMHYSLQRQAYELRILLKQGFYNYRYVVKDILSGKVDQTFFEGNYYDTENNYLVLIYYRQPGVRYDRLVGMKRINTRNTL